jgi:hypothetical protein
MAAWDRSDLVLVPLQLPQAEASPPPPQLALAEWPAEHLPWHFQALSVPECGPAAATPHGYYECALNLHVPLVARCVSDSARVMRQENAHGWAWAAPAHCPEQRLLPLHQHREVGDLWAYSALASALKRSE